MQTLDDRFYIQCSQARCRVRQSQTPESPLSCLIALDGRKNGSRHKGDQELCRSSQRRIVASISKIIDTVNGNGMRLVCRLMLIKSIQIRQLQILCKVCCNRAILTCCCMELRLAPIRTCMRTGTRRKLQRQAIIFRNYSNQLSDAGAASARTG